MNAEVVPGTADLSVDAHLDDAALLRALDGECAAEDGDAGAGARALAHLGACAVCTARAERLRDRRARLSALLAATDVAVPAGGAAPRPVVLRSRLRPVLRRTRPARTPLATPRATRPVARLAAAGVLLAAAGLAAQPVRQWVAARWAALAGATRGTVVPRAADAHRAVSTTRDTAAGAPSSSSSSVAVTFTPDPGAFTVRFDARPTGGTLTVRVAAGSRATATARADAGARAADLVVLPSGLRVRTGGALGTYEVAVPAGTRRVRVAFDAPASDTMLALAARAAAVVRFGAP